MLQVTAVITIALLAALSGLGVGADLAESAWLGLAPLAVALLLAVCLPLLNLHRRGHDHRR